LILLLPVGSTEFPFIDGFAYHGIQNTVKKMSISYAVLNMSFKPVHIRRVMDRFFAELIILLIKNFTF